jgi:hypothetical protein
LSKKKPDTAVATTPSSPTLATSEIMSADLATFPMSKVVAGWLLLANIEKMIKDRKEVMRERLLNEAEAGGQTSSSGSQSLPAEGATIVRERRESKQLPFQATAALLHSKGIPVEDACDEVVSYVVNQSKIQNMVDLGKLKQAEVDALREVTWALRVIPTEEVKQRMEEAAASIQKKVPAKT